LSHSYPSDCEAWKLTKTEAKKLDGSQYKYMKRMLRVTKVASDHLPTTNSGEHRSEQEE